MITIDGMARPSGLFFTKSAKSLLSDENDCAISSSCNDKSTKHLVKSIFIDYGDGDTLEDMEADILEEGEVDELMDLEILDDGDTLDDGDWLELIEADRLDDGDVDELIEELIDADLDALAEELNIDLFSSNVPLTNICNFLEAPNEHSMIHPSVNVPSTGCLAVYISDTKKSFVQKARVEPSLLA